MDIPSRKRALRRGVRERILTLDPFARWAQEEALATRFETLPGLGAARTVLLYVSAFPEEIDTGPMLRAVLDRGQRLVCPRVDRAGGRLKLHRVENLERDLVPGTLAIPEPCRLCPEIEPEAIDWVLVPGLAFDDRRQRLGRGAGHYDRLLPALRPDAPRWALILDCQWVETLPAEPHDVPLDGIASPGKEVHREGERTSL
jgi:5-formyltetrahydrofolate cyclo-ligase